MIELFAFVGLLGVGYAFGSSREKAHLRSLDERERRHGAFRVRTESRSDFGASEAKLVTASVVIASDYFKNFMASVRSFFGGRVTDLEVLMDRARREAVLRIQAQARDWGSNEIVGLRFEFSSIDRSGVEVLAYGTALKSGIDPSAKRQGVVP